MTLQEIIKKNKEKLGNTPISLIPHKEDKSIYERTPEKARALMDAVSESIRKSRESGFITKTPGGYKISWTKNRL